MKYLVLDTETTGLGAKDEVIQFTGILLNEEFKLSKLYNWYCESCAKISDGAYKTHGIDAKKLHQLSEGHSFEDNWYTMENLLNLPDITFIGWNISFDIRLINQTLAGSGLNTYDFGEARQSLRKIHGHNNLDLMQFIAKNQYGRARVKLAVAAEDAFTKNKDGVGIVDADSLFERFAKATKNDPSVAYHNSLYDTFITMLLFTRNVNKLFI